MDKPFSITPEQENILNRFTCERLTADQRNKDLVWRFSARRNRGLAWALQDAWDEDADRCPTAYYVVKDTKGTICLYFSLRCGVLYDPDFVQDVMDRYERSRDLINALNREECSEWATEYLESLRTDNGAIPAASLLTIRSDYFAAKSSRKYILRDKKVDSERMMRVDKAMPAVELVHFCVNDWARRDWRELGLGHGMGETLFWWIVVPKIAEINALTGCEYVYLFAADSSRDQSLVNYYETALHFTRPKKLVTIKPRYDFLCPLMCRRLYRLSDLRKNALDELVPEEEEADPLGLWDYRQLFLDRFNDIPEDAV